MPNIPDGRGRPDSESTMRLSTRLGQLERQVEEQNALLGQLTAAVERLTTALDNFERTPRIRDGQ